MKHYDSIVVGSGISGLTIAHLLASNGHKVLIIEKSKHIGGSMVRFQKKGIPFDTGFHFTGAFLQNGVLSDMLSILEMQDKIEPIILPDENGQVYAFEDDKTEYFLPNGLKRFIEKLKDYFPDETEGIDAFFALAEKIYAETISLDLLKISQTPHVLDEDYISLREVLEKLFVDDHLRGILATYSMCYGVKPSDVSIANHCRVAYGMYDSVVRIKNGGNAFIDAFKEKFSHLDIEIKTDCTIEKCEDVEGNIVGKFVLSTGEELSCDQCIFTIHPKAVLNVLPQDKLRKAFKDRVEAFEPAAGFFTLFGIIEEEQDNFSPSIVSIFPKHDFNELLESDNKNPSALVLMTGYENVDGKKYKVLTAMEPSFTSDVEQWKDSTVGKRPEAYYQYKEAKIAELKERMFQYNPEYKKTFKLITASSILTYRDYLNSYECTAYGIKQKMGQFNLFGKLPLRNIYACGQSSILPGVVGAMMSSFIVARTIVGKEKYEEFIKARLIR